MYKLKLLSHSPLQTSSLHHKRPGWNRHRIIDRFFADKARKQDYDKHRRRKRKSVTRKQKNTQLATECISDRRQCKPAEKSVSCSVAELSRVTDRLADAGIINLSRRRKRYLMRSSPSVSCIWCCLKHISHLPPPTASWLHFAAVQHTDTVSRKWLQNAVLHNNYYLLDYCDSAMPTSRENVVDSATTHVDSGLVMLSVASVCIY